jgi:DNA-binding transcriptional ArsR family regulator
MAKSREAAIKTQQALRRRAGGRSARHDQTAAVGPATLERAADIFRALGDAPRLRLLLTLLGGERSVSELVGASKEKFSTVSQRLRVLRSERLVARRRERSHVYYSLADSHIADLVRNAVAHAAEVDRGAEAGPGVERKRVNKRRRAMPKKQHAHKGHDHKHGPGCGHTAVRHDGHVDYLHDGHLHHIEDDGSVSEHALEAGGKNPALCTPKHDCGGHPKGHKHGPGCGHEAVPHGDHVDYVVERHLHHPHGDHCDDHGPVQQG